LSLLVVLQLHRSSLNAVLLIENEKVFNTFDRESNRMEQTDQMIWEQIRRGEVNALRDLHNRYYFALCNFANKTLNQLPVAEELVSTCFVRLWEKRKTIAVQHSLKSYLYFMVRNQVVDHLRSYRNNLLLLTSEMPEVPTEEEMNDLDFYAELYQAIAKLPGQRRKILEMAAFDSLSYSEIALRLDISVNTVKTQMGRAYRFLKSELDPRKFILLLNLCPAC
jgi:RNA polymerase sigma-70 factor (ECF subfamily)